MTEGYDAVLMITPESWQQHWIAEKTEPPISTAITCLLEASTVNVRPLNYLLSSLLLASSPILPSMVLGKLFVFISFAEADVPVFLAAVTVYSHC